MRVLGFSSIRSMSGRPLRGLFIVVALLGAVGCDQVLLRASGSPSSDGGEAGIAAPITPESHTTFADYTCVSCHDHSADVAAGRHVFISRYMFQSSACFSCHSTGNEAAITPDEHSLKYFPITDAAHGSLACTDCHQDPTTSKPFTCISCHDHSSDGEATNHSGVAGYTYDSSSCFNCHKAPSD
jgi:hypothetical protein